MLDSIMKLFQSTLKLRIVSPLRCFGCTFVLLFVAPNVFEGALRGTSQTVAGSWFYDLLSLTQPRGSGVNVNQPFSPYEATLYEDKRRSTLIHHHWTPTGRKTIRETPIPNDMQQVPPYALSTVRGESSVPAMQLVEQPPRSMDNAPISDNSQASQSNLLSQETAICHALTGLTPQQRQMCLHHSGLVWAMLEGTQIGLHECLHQFQQEQWNCSAVNILYQVRGDSSSLPPVSGMEGILQRGSREAAFLSSAWSAGVVQAITRACSRGQMATCDCDPQRREGKGRDAEGVFTWGGCSDPIKFGMRLTRLFLDATDRAHRQASIKRERQLHGPMSSSAISTGTSNTDPSETEGRYIYRRYARSIGSKPSSTNETDQNTIKAVARGNYKNVSNSSHSVRRRLSPQELQAETLRIMQTKARALMNLHNRRAGRRLIWKTRIRKCKCHGVSGACSMRTCWQRVNEFRHIGSMLKAAYVDAIRVAYDPRNDVLKPTKSHRYQIHLNTGIPSGHREPHRYMTHRFDSDGRKEERRSDWAIPKGHRVSTAIYSEDVDELDDWRRRRWSRAAEGSELVSKGKLIYLEESPNYCRFDPTIGHLGIAGRLCNANNTFETNSCARLCCDKGYDTIDFERERKCECKFVWCCEVRCNVCRERIIEHRCKH